MNHNHPINMPLIEKQITMLAQLRERFMTMTPEDNQHAATLQALLAFNERVRQQVKSLQETLFHQQRIGAGDVLNRQNLLDFCYREIQACKAVLLRTACQLNPGELRIKLAKQAYLNAMSEGELQKNYDYWILTYNSEPTTFMPFADAFFSFFALLNEHASPDFVQELQPQIQEFYHTFRTQCSSSWERALGLRAVLPIYASIELFSKAVTMLHKACQEPLDAQNGLIHQATLSNQLYCLRDLWQTLQQHTKAESLTRYYRKTLISCCDHLHKKLHQAKTQFVHEQALLRDLNEFLNHPIQRTAAKESELTERLASTVPHQAYSDRKICCEITRIHFRNPLVALEQLNTFQNTPADQFLKDLKQSRSWMENLYIELSRVQIEFSQHKKPSFKGEQLVSAIHQLWQHANNSAALEDQLSKLRTALTALHQTAAIQQAAPSAAVELIEQHYQSMHPAAGKPKLITREIVSHHPAEPLPTLHRQEFVSEAPAPTNAPQHDSLWHALRIAKHLSLTPPTETLQRKQLTADLHFQSTIAIKHLAHHSVPAMQIMQLLAPYSEILAALYLANETDCAVDLFNHLYAAVPPLHDLIATKHTANHAAIHFLIYFSIGQPQPVPRVLSHQIQLACRQLFKTLTQPQKNLRHIELTLDYLAFLLNCVCKVNGQLDESCLHSLGVLNMDDYSALFFKTLSLETLSLWKAQLFHFDTGFTRLLAQELARRLRHNLANTDTRALAAFLTTITRGLVQAFATHQQLNSLRDELNTINHALLAAGYGTHVLFILSPNEPGGSPTQHWQQWCVGLLQKAVNAAMSPQDTLAAEQHLRLLPRVTDHLRFTCQQTPTLGSSLVIQFLRTVQQAPVAQLLCQKIDVDELIKQALLKQDPLMLSLSLVMCSAQPTYCIALMKLIKPLKSSWLDLLHTCDRHQHVQAADFIYAAYSWILWRLHHHKANLHCSVTLWRLMVERENAAPKRFANVTPRWALHANALRTVLTPTSTQARALHKPGDIASTVR